MEINKTIKNLKQASDGKKTYIAGAIALIFDIVNDIFPDMLSVEKEATIQKIIFYLIYYGVIDKLWRNREDLIIFIKQLINKTFKKKEK